MGIRGIFVSAMAAMLMLAAIDATAFEVIDSAETMVQEEEEASSTGPRRKPNFDYLIDIGFPTLSPDGPNVPFGFEEKTGTMIGTGIGGHVPVVPLGPSTTIWIFLMGQIDLNFGAMTDDGNTPNIIYDLAGSAFATFSIGGMRKKSQAWGAEAGLGVSAVYSIDNGAVSSSDPDEKVGGFTIAPAFLIDVVYAPGNVYRLGFMMDIIPRDMGFDLTYTKKGLFFSYGW